MKHIIYPVLSIFVSLLFFIHDLNISCGAEPVRMIKSNILIDDMLKKLDEIQRNCNVKDYFPKVPPYPSAHKTNEIAQYVDRNVRDLRSFWLVLVFSVYKDSDNREIKVDWNRKDRTRLFLALLRSIYLIKDPNFDMSVPVFMNLIPIPDVSDDSGQIFLSGMRAEDIKNPKTRENYEKALWENFKNAVQKGLIRDLDKLSFDTNKSFKQYAQNTYSLELDHHQELIDFLEKYEYPETERIKLLADLQISYKGFRNWESKDKLFKATAKFISLEKGEVKLEKSDRNETTIELSVLRKEDQDYIKQQLEPKKKTVENEKIKME